jgi:hypothetical protein
MGQFKSYRSKTGFSSLADFAKNRQIWQRILAFIGHICVFRVCEIIIKIAEPLFLYTDDQKKPQTRRDGEIILLYMHSTLYTACR